MKTVQQLAMWFVDTMGFLDNSKVGDPLAVRRQLDRLGESLASFLSEIAKRTQGATLDDFIRTALVRDIKQEIQNTLTAIEGLVNDLHDPAIFSVKELAEALKEKTEKEQEPREEIIKSLAEGLSPNQIRTVLFSCLDNDELVYDSAFLQKIITAIENHADTEEYPPMLINCAERLIVLAKKADSGWIPPKTSDGMADLRDFLGLNTEAGQKTS